MIRARAVQNPKCLTPEGFRRWGVEDFRSEKRPCSTILLQVKRLKEKFEETYILTIEGDGLSVACPDDSPHEDIYELLHRVGDFIYGDLDDAIRVAKKREHIVRWSELANWDDLPQIRDALDKLPEIPTTTVNPACLPGGADLAATGRTQRASGSKDPVWRIEPYPENFGKMLELPGGHYLKDLERWMHKDRKTIINLDKAKSIYVQKLEGQKFKVWIRDPDLFTTTSTAMTSDGEREKGRKKEKKGKSGS